MPINEDLQERVVLLGSKVVGVNCSDCPFMTRDLEFSLYTVEAVECPNCGATIVTESQKSRLRRAGKF